MKKHIFHIAVSVALFFVLTAMCFINPNNTGEPFTVRERASESGVTLTTGENYTCVGERIEMSKLPKKVRAGDSVSMVFKGESNTEYSINVYYPTGLSSSEEFMPIISDAKGNFGWDFTVVPAAKEGMIRIVITGEKTHFMTKMEIVP